MNIGDRVRSIKDYSPMWPLGTTGVVVARRGNCVEVSLDLGGSTEFHIVALEVLLEVIPDTSVASHYQPVLPAPDVEPESKALTPDEIMDITRSFCR